VYFIKLTSLNSAKYELIQIRETRSSFRGGGVAFPPERQIGCAKNFGMTVIFTYILQAAFSYQSYLCTFYVLTIWFCNFLAKGIWRKSCSKNVGEIDTRKVDQLVLVPKWCCL
jgi:hypothetical protein